MDDFDNFNKIFYHGAAAYITYDQIWGESNINNTDLEKAAGVAVEVGSYYAVGAISGIFGTAIASGIVTGASVGTAAGPIGIGIGIVIGAAISVPIPFCEDKSAKDMLKEMYIDAAERESIKKQVYIPAGPGKPNGKTISVSGKW